MGCGQGHVRCAVIFEKDIREAMDVQQTLTDRDKTHGSYPLVADTIVNLKQVAHRAAHRARENNPDLPQLSPAQAEGIDMILHKIGRILNGDPNEADHWRDIAGYATLNSNLITKGTHL